MAAFSQLFSQIQTAHSSQAELTSYQVSSGYQIMQRLPEPSQTLSIEVAIRVITEATRTEEQRQLLRIYLPTLRDTLEPLYIDNSFFNDRNLSNPWVPDKQRGETIMLACRKDIYTEGIEALFLWYGGLRAVLALLLSVKEWKLSVIRAVVAMPHTQRVRLVEIVAQRSLPYNLQRWLELFQRDSQKSLDLTESELPRLEDPHRRNDSRKNVDLIQVSKPHTPRGIVLATTTPPSTLQWANEQQTNFRDQTKRNAKRKRSGPNRVKDLPATHQHSLTVTRSQSNSSNTELANITTLKETSAKLHTPPLDFHIPQNHYLNSRDMLESKPFSNSIIIQSDGPTSFAHYPAYINETSQSSPLQPGSQYLSHPQLLNPAPEEKFNTGTQYQVTDERLPKRPQVEPQKMPGNLALRADGHYFSFLFTGRPMIENLPEIFRAGVKTSNLWREEEQRGGLAFTNSLAIHLPKMRNEDALFVVRVSYHHGFDICNMFGLGDPVNEGAAKEARY